MRTCGTCGITLSEDAAVCPQCGTPVSKTQPALEPWKQKLVNSAFGMSLAGLICSVTGYVAIVGIILSVIGSSKVKKAYEAGCACGKLKAAKILSIIGMVAGAATIIVLILCIALLNSQGAF